MATYADFGFVTRFSCKFALYSPTAGRKTQICTQIHANLELQIPSLVTCEAVWQHLLSEGWNLTINVQTEHIIFCIAQPARASIWWAGNYRRKQMVPLSCHRTIISAAIQLFTLSCVVVVAPTHSERRAIIYQQRYHVFPVHVGRKVSGKMKKGPADLCSIHTVRKSSGYRECLFIGQPLYHRQINSLQTNGKDSNSWNHFWECRHLLFFKEGELGVVWALDCSTSN